MSELATSKFVVPVVDEKSSESSCVEFNLHSCYYNDFFLLRTPITINGRPAKIKLAESGPDKDSPSPYLHVEEIGVKMLLSKTLKIAAKPLHNHGVYHVDAFYHEHVPLFSVLFNSMLQLEDFLQRIENVQCDIATALTTEIKEDCSKSKTTLVSQLVNIHVEAQLFLVSPTCCSQEGSPKVYQVTLATIYQCVEKWKKSAVFDFRPDLFNGSFDQLSPPKSSTVVKADLADLQRELYEVGFDWFALGVQLKIPPAELLKIRNDHHNQTNECCLQMLVRWEQLEMPTWPNLVRGLGAIGKRVLAERIGKKYGVLDFDVKPPALESAMYENDTQDDLEFAERVQQLQDQRKISFSLEEIDTNIPELHRKIKALNSEITTLRRKLKLRKEEIDCLEEEKEKMEQHCLHAIEWMKKIQKEKNEILQKKLKKKETELACLRSQFAENENTLKNEIHQLQTEIDSLRKRDILKIEKQAFESVAASEMQTSLNRVTMQLDLTKEELTNKQEDIDQRSRELSDFKEKVEQLTSMSQENETTMLQLRQELKVHQKLTAEQLEKVSEETQLQLSSLLCSTDQLRKQITQKESEDDKEKVHTAFQHLIWKPIMHENETGPGDSESMKGTSAATDEPKCYEYIDPRVFTENRPKIQQNLSNEPISANSCQDDMIQRPATLPQLVPYSPPSDLSMSNDVMTLYDDISSDILFHTQEHVYVNLENMPKITLPPPPLPPKPTPVQLPPLPPKPVRIPYQLPPLPPKPVDAGTRSKFFDVKKALSLPEPHYTSKDQLPHSMSIKKVASSPFPGEEEYEYAGFMRHGRKDQNAHIAQMKEVLGRMVIHSSNLSSNDLHMLVTEDDDESEYEQRPSWAKATTTLSKTPTENLMLMQRQALFIPRSAVRDLKPIGEGQFGKVYRAKLHKDSCTINVAVKTIKSYKSQKATDDFLREMTIMSQMIHPNIVRLYGLVQQATSSSSPWMVLEFLANGDLKDFLTKNKRPVETLVKYMLDVAVGMHYIAEKGLVHRDLSARNIFVDGMETCKVADFGLLQELPPDATIYTSSSRNPLPIRWMAPESLLNRQFSTASDVWSYGVLLWEMFQPDQIPYSEYRENLQCGFAVIQGHRLQVPEPYPPVVERIMKACWHQVPQKRPSFQLICQTLLTIQV